MIICVIGQNIKDHPAEHLLTVSLWQVKLTANVYQLFIAFSLRTNGGQRLGIEFAVTILSTPISDHFEFHPSSD